MKKMLVLILSLVIVGSAVVAGALVYIMTQGVGTGRCIGPIKGKLLRFSVADDNLTVKFVISLYYPPQIEKWKNIHISLNLSGKLVNLNFNSSDRAWKGEYFTTTIYDLNRNGIVDSGDYLIVHSRLQGFSRGDSVRMSVIPYTSYLSAAMM